MEATLSFTLTDRMGRMETDPPLTRIDEVLTELDITDEEHTDIAISHESGWTLSAYPDGLVVLENVESDDEPRHTRVLSREDLRTLFSAIARGEVQEVEHLAWQQGYQ
jgi:hypothetical protein